MKSICSKHFSEQIRNVNLGNSLSLFYPLPVSYKSEVNAPWTEGRTLTFRKRLWDGAAGSWLSGLEAVLARLLFSGLPGTHELLVLSAV